MDKRGKQNLNRLIISNGAQTGQGHFPKCRGTRYHLLETGSDIQQCLKIQANTTEKWAKCKIDLGNKEHRPCTKFKERLGVTTTIH